MSVEGVSSGLGISDGWRFYGKRRIKPSPYHMSFTIARRTAEGTRVCRAHVLVGRARRIVVGERRGSGGKGRAEGAAGEQAEGGAALTGAHWRP